MWHKFLLLMMLMGGMTADAAVDISREVPRREVVATQTVRAATAKAVLSLYDQIAQMPLKEGVTVSKFAVDTGTKDELMKALERAEQLGGPRWMDQYTCQVHLQVSSQRVGTALAQLAATHRDFSPVTPGEVDRAVARWPKRVFSATGSSTAAQKLAEIRPVMEGRWAAVSEEQRQQALKLASEDAVRRTMESVGPVKLADSGTVSDVMASPEMLQSMSRWLASRPVTRVNFRDDLQVEVVLGVDEREFFDEFRAAAGRYGEVKLAADDRQWMAVERDFVGRVRPAVGRASVAGVAEPSTKVAVRIPRTPPEWVYDRIEIEGSAAAQASKLQTRARAEAVARQNLRQRIEAMSLEKDVTLGQAARDDRRVAEAIGRGVEQARVFKTDYRSDGSVVVFMIADLRDVWREMAR